MSQRGGIRINDWFSQMCLGVFFFCIGALFLTLFLSADGKAIMEELIGFIILMLIPTVFMDLGFILVISGWKRRHATSPFNPGSFNTNNPPGVSTNGGVVSEEQQKTVQAISGGISAIYKIYIWIQRLVSVTAAAIALLATAFVWLMSVSDLMSGKASLGGGLLLVLGLVLVSYIAIIYFMLLKKPRANPN